MDRTRGKPKWRTAKRWRNEKVHTLDDAEDEDLEQPRGREKNVGNASSPLPPPAFCVQNDSFSPLPPRVRGCGPLSILVIHCVSRLLFHLLTITLHIRQWRWKRTRVFSAATSTPDLLHAALISPLSKCINT